MLSFNDLIIMHSLVKQNIFIAIDAIKNQKLKTSLTIFIITIGITALVGILTLIEALENTIYKDFTSMGANTFSIQPNRSNLRPQNKGKRTVMSTLITLQQVNEFIEQFQYPSSKTTISFEGTRTAEVVFENKNTDPEVRILGIDENYIYNTGTKIDKGRNFSQNDIMYRNNVCLIGSDLLKKLFKDKDPINQVIKVKGFKFKIVGILAPKGARFRNNQDLRVLIPLHQARSIFNNIKINYKINIKVNNKAYFDGALQEAIATFRNVRNLNPLDENNFEIERSDSLLRRISKITIYLYFAAWIISLITIFGSSVALMNIMLVTVTERTREIGIRKALGARKKTIASQFLIETIIIGQVGGLLGIIIGISAGAIIAHYAKFNFTTPWIAIFSASIVSFLIAIVSGLYPALKAANQDPIKSLKYE